LESGSVLQSMLVAGRIVTLASWMMEIRIEDNFEDVLMKACTGLGIGKQALSESAGLPLAAVAALLNGEYNEASVRAVAPVLALDVEALISMANQAWAPAAIEVSGLKCYNTPFPVPGYEEMTVNSYLVWSPKTKVAIAFDTGANVDALLADVQTLGLDLQALAITHSHRDHIAAYEALLESIEGSVAFAPELEPYADADPLTHGDSIDLEGLHIEVRLTNGHSPGGTTYVVEGLAQPVAIVGDALFCLSQGGAVNAYAQALESNRAHILSLSDDTVLCAGHGPLTTVANEKARNPFFPEFKS
jgi:glyoxylase-like metal-dependent hydrolase (beta-lactamase superfamily II)